MKFYAVCQKGGLWSIGAVQDDGTIHLVATVGLSGDAETTAKFMALAMNCGTEGGAA